MRLDPAESVAGLTKWSGLTFTWPIGGGTIDAVYKATIGASLFEYGGAEHATLVPLLMSRARDVGHVNPWW